MLISFRISVAMLFAMTALTGFAYPLAITAIAQIAFPDQANGSILRENGQAVGSTLVGQAFAKPERFWGRLSHTERMPYNAGLSGGSNFGPLHPDLLKNAKERIDRLKLAGTEAEQTPVDLVTASGSGLDPHISPAAARIQAARVARARRMSLEEIMAAIQNHTEGRDFGLLGEPRVNVLLLNRSLDRQRR